jgi:hypothetical protein
MAEPETARKGRGAINAALTFFAPRPYWSAVVIVRTAIRSSFAGTQAYSTGFKDWDPTE